MSDGFGWAALRAGRVLLAAGICIAAAACAEAESGPGGAAGGREAAPPAPGDAEDGLGEREELERLYRDRDYFRLRSLLERRRAASDAPEPPRVGFLRAAVLHAFNRPADSHALVRDLLEGPTPLPDTLVARLHRLRYHNLLRMHRYGDAAEAGEAILASPGATARMRSDVRNELRALRALRDVPAQEVVRRGPVRLEPTGGRVPVRVDGSERRYALDTGANFSTLMRSEARELGLEIRPAGVELGTATDVRVAADVAVAGAVGLGEAELRNVVFLVLPDAALTFPGGVEIRGLVGFPVLEALGALRFFPDGAVETAGGGEAGRGEFALEQLTPLVRVGFRGEDLVCRLDTGADRTAFYEPFHRRFRAFVEESGRAYTARAGGAGGVREIPAVRLRRIDLEVAGRSVGLEAVDVYGRRLVEEEENYLACNLGRDLLDATGGYVLDFGTMSFGFP